MWRPVYYMLISLGGVLFLPWWLLRARRKGRGLWPLLRLGFKKQNLEALPNGGIWVHALSVGEVNSALPLLGQLQKSGLPLYFSVATYSGWQLAVQKAGCPVLVRPLDVPWVVNRWLKALKPKNFILVESDMWPAWQRAIKQAGIKSALLNARISPRSLRAYLKFKPAARLLYEDFDFICVQSGLDQQRLNQIGICHNVRALGNLKFDSLPAPLTVEEKQRLGKQLGLTGRVVVCGSTHAGEEEVCLNAWRELPPDVCLVIAPREVKRAPQILAMLPAGQGWLASRGAMPDSRRVLVLDLMGLLAKVYALASAAFIGGSLVEQSGHNPLEAATQGVPVCFGPHMEDFLQMAESLINTGAACRVNDGRELAACWQSLLGDSLKAGRMGTAGQQFCQANQGAAMRIARCLAKADANA